MLYFCAMAHFKVLFTLGIVVIVGSATLTHAISSSPTQGKFCPGDIATLHYTIAQVALASGGECSSIRNDHGYVPYLGDSENPMSALNTNGSGTGAVRYVVLPRVNNRDPIFTLTCTNPGAPSARESVTLVVDEPRNCCPGGTTWNDARQSCVTGRPEAPIYIGGSCKRI